MKSAGNWVLCKVIIVMNTHFTVLAEISVSCLCFEVLRTLEMFNLQRLCDLYHTGNILIEAGKIAA